VPNYLDNCPNDANGDQADADNDIVGDLCDNCRYAVNPGQEDEGGLNTDLSDGIGKACQCGDVTDDGEVNSDDLDMLRDGLAGVAPISAPEKCNVWEAADVSSQDEMGVTPDCQMNDATVLERELSDKGPRIQSVCAPALP
jgi:hypothetical protein